MWSDSPSCSADTALSPLFIHKANCLSSQPQFMTMTVPLTSDSQGPPSCPIKHLRHWARILMMPGRLEASTLTCKRSCLLTHYSSIRLFAHLRSRPIHFTYLNPIDFPLSLFTTCFGFFGSIGDLAVHGHDLPILPSYSSILFRDLDSDHQILRHPPPCDTTTTSSA
jgi:hypothetical protein